LLVHGGIGEVAFNLPSAATAGEEKGEPNETACLREPVFAGKFAHCFFLLAVAAEGFFQRILSDLPHGISGKRPCVAFLVGR
jgi:hypothetical protein